MANEIRIEAQLEYSKNGRVENKHASAFVDADSDFYHSITQNVTTSNTKLGDELGVSGRNWGYMFVRNLDSTNFVQISALDDANYFLKLKAGEFALFRAATENFYAKADTDVCLLEITAVSLSAS